MAKSTKQELAVVIQLTQLQDGMNELKKTLEGHMAGEERTMKEFNDKIDDIKNTVKPISDTYSTASRIGKWFMGLLVFISVSVGVVAGIRNLLKR